MPARNDQRLQEASLLTRAVENVFRKLIRLLVGRISLVRLQEMIRHIYVEETERKLQAEAPGRNVPLTRLALATGLDTRALVQIRRQIQLGEPQYRQQFLSELTPESAVVEAWAGRGRRPTTRGTRPVGLSVSRKSAPPPPGVRIVRPGVAGARRRPAVRQWVVPLDVARPV